MLDMNQTPDYDASRVAKQRVADRVALPLVEAEMAMARATLQAVAASRRTISSQIVDVRERLATAEAERRHLKAQLADLGHTYVEWQRRLSALIRQRDALTPKRPPGRPAKGLEPKKAAP